MLAMLKSMLAILYILIGPISAVLASFIIVYILTKLPSGQKTGLKKFVFDAIIGVLGAILTASIGYYLATAGALGGRGAAFIFMFAAHIITPFLFAAVLSGILFLVYFSAIKNRPGLAFGPLFVPVLGVVYTAITVSWGMEIVRPYLEEVNEAPSKRFDTVVLWEEQSKCFVRCRKLLDAFNYKVVIHTKKNSTSQWKQFELRHDEVCKREENFQSTLYYAAIGFAGYCVTEQIIERPDNVLIIRKFDRVAAKIPFFVRINGWEFAERNAGKEKVLRRWIGGSINNFLPWKKSFGKRTIWGTHGAVENFLNVNLRGKTNYIMTTVPYPKNFEFLLQFIDNPSDIHSRSSAINGFVSMARYLSKKDLLEGELEGEREKGRAYLFARLEEFINSGDRLKRRAVCGAMYGLTKAQQEILQKKINCRPKVRSSREPAVSGKSESKQN